ncbi:MAG: MarR family transcriptional regulator [Paludibacteraceae bacterium]|nr:MarR family transcriptional regulator [Paludibacteraceae bacterium]
MNDKLKLENQLCFRLYTAARLTMQAYWPYFEPLGLTYPQYLVLLVLWEKDSQPVNDIARKLMLETNTVTPLLQRMEKQGLVVRTKGKEDSRQRIVSLTEKGRALEAEAEHIPDCLSNEISARTDNMEELEQMIPQLDKLISALKTK